MSHNIEVPMSIITFFSVADLCQDWAGDNMCDDECNTPEWNYDAGDCCGDEVNVDYCTTCECIQE